MKEIPGIIRPELQQLPQVKDRMTFLYLERCKLNRRDSAIEVIDDDGTVNVPAAAISVLILGPGSGRPLTKRAGLLLQQARLVSNQRLHLSVVRKMYEMRFPNEDVSRLTLQQLRGREGSRVREIYRKLAKQYGISWHGREYNPDDFYESNAVNQALSAGHACLYGLAHAVIVALGCSPGLGFVHVGHELSFVYDLADLYKAEVTIPIAFEAASQDLPDLPAYVRRKTRDAMTEGHILERMVHDLHYLLEIEEAEADVVELWNYRDGTVKNGISYKADEKS